MVLRCYRDEDIDGNGLWVNRWDGRRGEFIITYIGKIYDGSTCLVELFIISWRIIQYLLNFFNYLTAAKILPNWRFIGILMC